MKRLTMTLGTLCLVSLLGATLSGCDEDPSTPAGSADSAGDTASGGDTSGSDTAGPNDMQEADTTGPDDTHTGDTHTGDAHTGDAHTGDTHTGDAHTGDTHAAEPHWSYSGETGPESWGTLSDEWATCGTGMHQSPIDIPAVSPSSHPEMTFGYGTSKAVALNNGHTVQFDYDPGSTLEVDGHTWDLLQFHYHSHSEHTVGGVDYPVELHFVHEDSAGKLAVVGVLLEEGAENAALAAVADNLPASEQEATEVPGVTLDAAAMLPAEHASWRYEGSLTTPPCTEGVEWFVMSEPVEASAAQIGKFAGVYDHNYRPTQPLNDRKVEGPHWGYTGEVGPDHWDDLSPAFAACGSGAEQSPIDIPAVDVAADTPATFTMAYSPSEVAILNNGHTVQVDWAPGSTLTLDSGTYELQQFHFHAHSEHLVDGADYPLELHFVHKSAAGALAVVGVMVEEGVESAQLATILPYVPAAEAPVAAIPDTMVDATALMPASTDSWRYDGSLTTPPCTEGVSWTVMAAPISASKDQIDALATVLHDNYRPTQALNARKVNGM